MKRHAPSATGFDITFGRGFHITFENGHTVSVQFGGGNYCSNYDVEIGAGRNGRHLPPSATAEVAAWDSNGQLVRLGDGDDVIGYQTPAEVLALLNKIAARPHADRS